MKFEVATSKYLDSICEITEQAKAQLGVSELTSGRKDIHQERYGKKTSR